MNLRIKSGKKIGGQEGNKWISLSFKDNPDEICIHKVEYCNEYGAFLQDEPVDGYIIRQAIDISKINRVLCFRGGFYSH